LHKIPANTLFLGKNLVFMPECHSTNSFALKLCQQSPLTADGTVVITSNQTAGRGQRGSTWQSEPGMNLTFSVIFKPAFLSVNHLFYLNVFSALAIRDYLTAKGCPEVLIKWPNDIYVNNKKLCGMLVENQLKGNELSCAVIGFGLNLNQQQFEVDIASSLSLILGHPFDLQTELEMVLSLIEARYLQLRQNKLPALMEDYLQSLYWLNEVHTFSAHGDFFEGTICGVDSSGRLRVRVNEVERAYGSKEIRYER
jgi:BirA family transcriptional regulator, biotin operon repressor / biotin---[acetyl-CoA-carboxylase] ligase